MLSYVCYSVPPVFDSGILQGTSPLYSGSVTDVVHRVMLWLKSRERRLSKRSHSLTDACGPQSPLKPFQTRISIAMAASTTSPMASAKSNLEGQAGTMNGRANYKHDPRVLCFGSKHPSYAFGGYR